MGEEASSGDPRLDRFFARALPAFLRRCRVWKGLRADWHPDVIDDLRQEIALDCLEHAAVIDRLDEAARHRRWFQLVQRHHYELRERGAQRNVGDEPLASVLDPGPALSAEPVLGNPGRNAGAIAHLLAHLHVHKNGRVNLEATARAAQLPERQARALWDRVVLELGQGPAFLAFWRRRLVEALLGLAADLLRDSGRLHLHDERARARPDPRARLRRIRRIRTRLARRPISRDLRAVLGHYRTARASALDPWAVLADAASLRRDDPDVALWQFEGAIAGARLDTAVAALRRARHAGADAVRTLLARARLLEARGREPAAAALLRRGLVRHDADPRVASSLAGLLGGGTDS